jgi:hypothetical protein
MNTTPEYRSYTLTDELAALLDGKGDEKLQASVNAAKERLAARAKFSELTDRESGLVAELVTLAKTDGILTYRFVDVSLCRVCGKSKTYVPYKSGGNRGRPNYDRPIYLRGIDFKESFITFKGSPGLGACTDCVEKLKPVILSELASIEAQLPRGLTGEEPKFKRWSIMRCSKCGWEGPEGKLRLGTAIMGGNYHSQCPSCNAENGFMNHPIKNIEPSSHVVLPASEECTERKVYVPKP